MNRAVRAAGRVAWWMTRIGLLLAGAGVVFVLSLWSTLERHFDASEVDVPDVRGYLAESAEDRLAQAGLGFAESRAPHDSSEAGTIVYQDPVPGAKSRKGRVVQVVVSTGPVRIATPQLVGRSRREALIELRNQQLAAGDVVQVHSPKKPDDVIAQVPPPGGVLDESGRVHLLVSVGAAAPAFVMPDLRGHPLSQAERLFSQVGLRVAEVREQFVPNQPDGTVQSQSPETGRRLVRETPIRLVVSRTSPVPTSALPQSVTEE